MLFSHPADLPGIAGPDRLLAVTLPSRGQISRQAEPGASLEVCSPSVLTGRVALHPVLPASELIPLRRSPGFRSPGETRSPQALWPGSSVRIFAFGMSGRDPTVGTVRAPNPAAGHASPLHISCDVPLLALRIFRNLAGRCVRPAALVGFDPSQSCSCHAGKDLRHPQCLGPPAVSSASIPAHFCREIDRQET